MSHRIFAMSHAAAGAGSARAPWPFAAARRAAPSRPTALGCLRCQVLGRRNLLCTQHDACRALPRVLPLGPVLLAAWLATTVAFVIAVW